MHRTKEVTFNDSSVRTRLAIAFTDVPRHSVCVLISQCSEGTRKTTSPY